MRKIKYLFILFVFYTFSLSANIHITGTVIDNKTKSPLAFVNIGIKDTYSGTTTNGQGVFSMVVPSNEKYRTLVFSSIGYESRECFVKSTDSVLYISLTPLRYDISEVTIMPDSTLRSFIRKAYLKIPENYPDTPTKYEGFCRESIQKEDGEYLRFMEVLTEAYKSSYKSKEEGTIKVLKSRKYLAENNVQSMPVYFYGGVHSIHYADYVKDRADFLSGSEMYNYKLTGKTKLDSTEVYVIEFGPAKIHTSKSKGVFYLDVNSLAFIKIEKERTLMQLRNRSAEFVGLHSVETKTVVFYSFMKNKNYIKSLYSLEKLKKKGSDTTLINKLEYVITSVSDSSAEKIEYIEQTPFTYTPALEAASYAESDWKDFNTLPLNNSLSLDSLKAKQLLSTNVKDKLDWRLVLGKIFKNIEMEYGIESSLNSLSENSYLLNYNDLSFHGDKSYSYLFSIYWALDYKWNKKNLLSYKENSPLTNDYTVKNYSLRYKRVIPVKTMGKNIIANLNAGWEWRKEGFSIGTEESSGDFSFDGKKFKNDKIQAYCGMKTNGVNVGAGIDFQLSGLFHLCMSTNYMQPIQKQDIIIFQERSGFFLFRKNGYEKLNQDDADYYIDGEKSQTSGIEYDNWSFSMGFKIRM